MSVMDSGAGAVDGSAYQYGIAPCRCLTRRLQAVKRTALERSSAALDEKCEAEYPQQNHRHYDDGHL